MLISFGVLDKRRGDGGVIRDEAPVIPALSQEGSESLQSVRDWPILDDGRVVRGDADPLGADFMSEIFDVVSEQLGLPRGDLKTGSTESCQDLP